MAHMSLKTVRRVHTRAAATPVAAFGIYAGRRSQEKFGWQPIDTAPIDKDVMLIVTDGHGEPYAIFKPLRLTAAGWVSSGKGTPLAVTPLQWKPYVGPRKR
jgi:hypothetical protein